MKAKCWLHCTIPHLLMDCCADSVLPFPSPPEDSSLLPLYEELRAFADDPVQLHKDFDKLSTNERKYVHLLAEAYNSKERKQRLVHYSSGKRRERKLMLLKDPRPLSQAIYDPSAEIADWRLCTECLPLLKSATLISCLAPFLSLILALLSWLVDRSTSGTERSGGPTAFGRGQLSRGCVIQCADG